MQDAVIKNPPSGGVLLLKAGQNAVVHLPNGEGEWDARTTGHFLAQDGWVRDKEYTEFMVFQLYDLTKWAAHSCVHLGTFTAEREYKGTNKNLLKEVREFPVVMMGDTAMARDILTVIDPQDETVVIYPHQLLEVVQTAVGDARLEPAFMGEYEMEQLTCRRALKASCTHPETWPDIDRTIPRLSLNPMLPNWIKPPDDFWSVPALARCEYRTFQLKSGAAKQVERLKNQITFGCVIALMDLETPSGDEITIDVNLCVRSQMKDRLSILPGRKAMLQDGMIAQKKNPGYVKFHCPPGTGPDAHKDGWEERAPHCAEFGCLKRVDGVWDGEKRKYTTWELYCHHHRWQRQMNAAGHRTGHESSIITLPKEPEESRQQGRYQTCPGFVANPTNDTYDFTPGGENILIVEIDAMASGKWEHEVTGLADKGQEAKIEVIELNRREASYGPVQRFCVMPRQKLPSATQAVFLGSVRFVNNEVRLFPRRVNVWLSEGKDEPKPNGTYRTVVTVSEVEGPLSEGAFVSKFKEIDQNSGKKKKRRNR